MVSTFQAKREEKRLAFLTAVESIRDRLLANADQAEALGYLPQDTVDALDDSGLTVVQSAGSVGRSRSRSPGAT